MKYLKSNVLSGVLVFLISLESVWSTVLNIQGPEIWKYFQLQCGRDCLYGYETDIEGNPLCKCRNPCSSVFCFGGTVCVIKKDRYCTGNLCQLEAYCEDFRDANNLPRDQFGNREAPENVDISNTLQKDSWTTGSTTKGATLDNVCMSKRPEESNKCDKKRKRYTFNPDKGGCVRFRGCQSEGNNFRRRKDCIKRCVVKRLTKNTKRRKSLKKVSALTQLKSTSKKPKVCLMPLRDSEKCLGRRVKRWHYSATKQNCVRVRTCKTSTGNYFRKRRECKRQCMRGSRRRAQRRRKNRRSKKGRKKRKNTI